MNETIEEKKKILNTYGAAVRKYHALKNQEKHLRMIINRPRAAVLSGMPSSNKHKDISDIMIKLDESKYLCVSPLLNEEEKEKVRKQIDILNKR